MADYFNKASGNLSVAGKEYEPGQQIPLTEKHLKDPVIDWLIRSKFVGPDDNAGNQFPTFLPTYGEAGEIQMTETAAQPNAPVKATAK